MDETRGRKLLARGVVAVVVGIAGLVLAAAAATATQTIQVGALLVVSGTATGSISGFQANGSVQVDGQSFVADATGTVTLTALPLGGATSLTIDFSDAGGAAHEVTAALIDGTSGLPLSPSQILDLIPNTTAPVSVSVEVGTTGSTSTGTTTGGTTTTGTTTTGGGGSGGSGASGGSGGSGGSGSPTMILAADVVAPDQLVISRVDFAPRLIASHKTKLTVRYRVLDKKGLPVAGAAVWMRTIPARQLTAATTKRTSTTGWVTFTLRPTAKLKLRNGGRVTVFVRAWTPGRSTIDPTSTRRLVSVRVTAGK